MDEKILIATPCYGGFTSSAYLESMLRLTKAGLDFDMVLINNESLITRARNTCVAVFLDNPHYTHLMFIDADIGFQPEAVVRLLQRRAPVVAGSYPKKRINWERAHAFASLDTDTMKHSAFDYVINLGAPDENFEDEDFDGVVTDGFMRVAYCGSGFLLIQRGAFDVLRASFPEDRYANDPGGGCYSASPPAPEHFWTFFDTLVHPRSHRYLSEDFAFCYKWRSCGGEIWLDATSRLTHIGSYPFQGDLGRMRGKDITD